LFIYGQIPFAGNKSAVPESRILNEQAAFLRRVHLESMASIPPRSGLHRNTRAFLTIAARREEVKSKLGTKVYVRALALSLLEFQHA
jgi:hypothetical protein